MPWVRDFQSGGVKIPPTVRKRTEQRIRDYADEHYSGKYTRLDIRFRGVFCYIDAYVEPAEPDADFLRVLGETREEYLKRLRDAPLHLCRLRHFTEDLWSMAFYAYSGMKYEPCYFDTGAQTGTPEEGFETAAMYLRED